MKNSKIGNLVATIIPVTLALVLGFMCFQQYRRKTDDLAQQAAEQQNVNSLDLILRSADIEPLTGKKFAVVATLDEQAQFLTQLRINAQGAGIKMVQYLNMGTIMSHPDPNKPQEAASSYRPVASTLTVQGPYTGVRDFAYSLLRSDRLMNMSGITWKRDPEGKTTTLSFTLIRYVTDLNSALTTTATVEPSGSAGGAIR